jgi:RNA polymerase sigma-70 factor (ECF subfamily)
VNLSVDRLRRRSHRGVSLDEIELDPAADTPANDAEEHLGKLRREVGRLPESLREVVLLFYFQDMSYAEMDRLLGITEAAVNQRLNRARQRLREGFGVEQEGGV